MGGIHPSYNKISRKSKIEVAPIPKTVVLPLQQHIGAPCEPLVEKGDKVKIGQKIAESKGFVSAPIHSSISGVVKSIEDMPHPIFTRAKAIIIESEGPLEYHESVKKRDNVNELSPKELIGIIKEAGIVGLGGAAFPTHVKLSPPPDKKIDTIILNGAECEPYLTCDHRLMLENTEEIIKGFMLIKKILNAKTAIIGIEDNKENAIAFMKNKIQDLNLTDQLTVQSLHTKYPQGGEKMLIAASTGRIVPAGGLPMDVGCLVSNIATCKAIYDAVWEGKPIVDRVVTITGAVKHPKNLLVRVGTSYKELIEHCGGSKGQVGKLISGGPMMGIAQFSLDVPTIKGTSGILIQLKDEVLKDEPKDCIRCSRCVDTCPMNLMPTTISKLAAHGEIDRAEENFATDCFECGCCAYVCPSKIPLTHWIKYAKSEIIRKKTCNIE